MANPKASSARLDSTLSVIDAEIRAGRGASAKLKLSQMSRAELPRPTWLRFAALARRAHLPWLALRLLSPLINPSGRSKGEASSAERAEYAASLIRVGAAEEGLRALRGLDARELPEVSLYQAYALFTQWRYGEALPLLESYIAAPSLDDYQRRVGQVNLVAALLYESRVKEADTLIEELLADAANRGQELLRGSLLNLSAQSAILIQNWLKAEQRLDLAEQALVGSEGLEAFFARKWRAVLSLLTRGRAAAAPALQSVREEAIRKQHWETLRDLMRHQAIATRDPDLFHHLYFGTPYVDYRARLSQDFDPPPQPAASYRWYPSERLTEGLVLDLWNGEARKTDHTVATLKVGQGVHRLLVTLCSDFFRPFPIAQLHFRTFPGETFNPLTSPLRVRQAIRRLRLWLDRNDLPFEVKELGGGYRLIASQGSGVEVHRELSELDRDRWCREKLESQWPNAAFSVLEASECLAMSGRSTHRVLTEGLSRGWIIREGTSSKTRYRLKKP